ncbi:hypothetical protein B296_00024059 [Ensete ventricosum]|uniref:Glutamine amidotransferase domain-containing protein n=1 Tax=Ensete ventricosum TaxID=4639 RepID=A0A427AQS4_ENSVE|nr:hypothetical protein B296_00024059 [Ensete ventricosum]
MDAPALSSSRGVSILLRPPPPLTLRRALSPTKPYSRIKTKPFSICASTSSDSSEKPCPRFSFPNRLFPVLVHDSSSCSLLYGGVAAAAVTLLDYGAGNVRSLRNAIRYLGFDIKDVSVSCVLSSPHSLFLGYFVAPPNSCLKLDKLRTLYTLERIGAKVQKPEDILSANRLVFPGVGAFAAAMEVLEQSG